MKTIICDYCGRSAELVSGRDIYPHREDLSKLKFWQCVKCDAYVGCHKNSNGMPLGRLANKELRKAKNKAHQAFDPLWRDGLMKRREAYSWLASKLSIKERDCHIGMFDVDMCERVIKAVNEFNSPQ